MGEAGIEMKSERSKPINDAIKELKDLNKVGKDTKEKFSIEE